MPEEKLGVILDFMEFLLEKERKNKSQEYSPDPGNDPVLSYIGGVSHGSLAKDIDHELYGESI